MILIASREEKELLERLRTLDKRDADKRAGYLNQIDNLRGELETLKIEKGRTQEGYDKQDRELRHMIGLEKKRQEFEIEQARQETTLKIREANLAAEQKRATEQMAFNNERFEKMEVYLKGMIEQILKRLPDVNVDIKRGK